jgi:hypothetical protein
MDEGHDSSPPQKFDPYAHGLPSGYKFLYSKEKEEQFLKTTEKIPKKHVVKKKKAKKKNLGK